VGKKCTYRDSFRGESGWGGGGDGEARPGGVRVGHATVIGKQVARREGAGLL